MRVRSHRSPRKKAACGKESAWDNHIEFTTDGPVGKVTFDQVFGAGPKFVRSLYKVALGSLAYFLGTEVAAGPQYDFVRAFVRKGTGDLHVLMLKAHEAPQHFFERPAMSPTTGRYVIGMSIFGVNFIADMDPNKKGVQDIENSAPVEFEFITLPPV